MEELKYFKKGLLEDYSKVIEDLNEPELLGYMLYFNYKFMYDLEYNRQSISYDVLMNKLKTEINLYKLHNNGNKQ